MSLIEIGLKNVIENEEANLKEFDLYSFKDAAISVKDSTVLYQHLVGVKFGYAMSNVKFSQSGNHKGITSTKNFGVYYTYFHSLLGNMPFFGLQIGLESTELGYTHVTEITENTFDPSTTICHYNPHCHCDNDNNQKYPEKHSPI